MDEDSVNRIVLSYLTKKKFASAREHFMNEAGLTSSVTQTSIQDLSLEGAVASHILFYNSAENVPSAYNTGYVQLREWIQASLDTYKVELHRILFPIFVYSFLEMCEKGFWAEAKRFAQDHSHAHDEMHAEDIRSLTSMSCREHLQSHELATVFLRNRVWVRMSRHSFDLLLGFLQERRLMLILSLINCRLQVEIFSGGPKQLTFDQELDERNVVFKYIHDNQAAYRKGPVHWGLSSMEPYYPRSLQQMQELNDIAFSDDDDDSKPPEETKTKKRKRLDSKHIPNVDETVEAFVIDELRKQVPLSASSLPSICFHTFLNTANTLNCLDMSRDATTVVSGYSDSSVRLYRFVQRNRTDVPESDRMGVGEFNLPPQTPNSFHTLTGHAGAVFGVSLDPTSEFAISCGEDSTVRLWSLEAMANLVVYKGHNFPVWDCHFNPLGYYFATAGHDRTARMWSTDHVTPLRIFAGHLSDVDCVRFHPNCNYLATGSTDKMVRLWDVQSGSSVRLFIGHRAAVSCLSFSPNGRVLATGGHDGQVMLWDLASASKMQSMPCKHLGAVHSLDFSADGTILATGHHKNAVCLWDISGAIKRLPNASDSSKGEDLTATSSAAANAASTAAAATSSTAAAGDDATQAQDTVTSGGTTQTSATAKDKDLSGLGLLHMAHTRFTPVFNVTFTHRNLLLASGPFVHPSPPKRERQW